jgi:hypothetical protein
MEVFKDDSLRRFEDEMVAHAKEFTPRLCKTIGDEQLRIAIRQAMKRADGYGFTNRGPIRLYIETMFFYGSDFDADPQYPALRKILDDPSDQMLRAENIYDIILDYKNTVSGPNAENLRRALKSVSAFAKNPLETSSSDPVAHMRGQLVRLYPQKAVYIGEEALSAVVEKAKATAESYEFTTIRGELLLAILMFAFGCGCTADPLYPWISRTLQDDRIVSPKARAERLERKAVTWLDHVLSGPWKGENA